MSVNETTRMLFESVLLEIKELPPSDRYEVELLIEHNEPVLAYETLTTQIYEWALTVELSTFAKLEELTSRLGLGAELLVDIRDELVVEADLQ